MRCGPLFVRLFVNVLPKLKKNRVKQEGKGFENFAPFLISEHVAQCSLIHLKLDKR